MQCSVLSIASACVLLGITSLDARAATPLPMPGAYQTAASIGPDERAAASAAVSARAVQEKLPLKLLTIERVERQVVAGLNFRLRLRVELGGQPRMVEAVVYRNLQGQHQLTSWQWLLSRRTQ